MMHFSQSILQLGCVICRNLPNVIVVKHNFCIIWTMLCSLYTLHGCREDMCMKQTWRRGTKIQNCTIPLRWPSARLYQLLNSNSPWLFRASCLYSVAVIPLAREKVWPLLVSTYVNVIHHNGHSVKALPYHTSLTTTPDRRAFRSCTTMLCDNVRCDTLLFIAISASLPLPPLCSATPLPTWGSQPPHN